LQRVKVSNNLSDNVLTEHGEGIMSSDLRKLTELARSVEMTPEEREAQRQSFAYGSAFIENANITRESIRRAAQEISSGKKQIIDQRAESNK
jgi:hypothetical protein